MRTRKEKRKRSEKNEERKKERERTNHALDTEFTDDLDTDADVHELVADEAAVVGAVEAAELDEDGDVPLKVRDEDVVVLRADLDDVFDETLAEITFSRVELLDQLAHDVGDVALVDHADEQIECAHADRHVLVVEAKHDDVLVLLHRLWVDLHDVVQRTQSQILDCKKNPHFCFSVSVIQSDDKG